MVFWGLIPYFFVFMDTLGYKSISYKFHNGGVYGPSGTGILRLDVGSCTVPAGAGDATAQGVGFGFWV